MVTFLSPVRRLSGLGLAVAIAGCVAVPSAPTSTPDSTPGSAPTSAPSPAATVAEAPALALAGEGIQLVVPTTGATRTIAFGTPMDAVVGAVSEAIEGTPEVVSNNECPVTATQWPNGLTLNAADDEFVGWGVRSAPGSDALTTMSGIGLGSTRAELESAYSAEVFESTLGTEFTAGDMAGLLSDATSTGTITDLWAGMVCIFR